MPDPTSPNDGATPSEENIATRSELTLEEQAAGSDDPTAQATAILSESEKRMEAASGDGPREAGVERRSSDETVDPPPAQ